MRISDGSSDVCSSDLGIRHDLSCRSPQTVEKAVNSMQRDSHRPEESVPYVIVVGSEKGGTGQSTTAIHLTVGLMKLGLRVGTIDLDPRQGRSEERRLGKGCVSMCRTRLVPEH